MPDASVAIVLSGSSTRREYLQRLGRILRPKAHGALLYELVTRDTAEPQIARRRRAGAPPSNGEAAPESDAGVAQGSARSQPASCPEKRRR